MVALALTAAAAGLSAVGAYQQYQGSKDQSAATQQQIAAEQKAEALRRRQMELEARRRQMEIIRNQQRTRSIALAATTAQGASQSSGLQGAYGQIGGQAGNQLLATGQNLEIGRSLFDASADVSSARMAYAAAGETASMGRLFSGLGSTVSTLTPQLTSLYREYGTPRYPGPTTYGGPTGSNPYMTSNSGYWA